MDRFVRFFTSLPATSKGRHLADNPDTKYKEAPMEYLSKAGERVSWKGLGEEFANHTFRFQVIDQGKYDHNWGDRLKSMMEATA
ncbi:MAG: hypothetical protein ACR2HJ_09620 [Fimbriimonadales bacterium]